MYRFFKYTGAGEWCLGAASLDGGFHFNKNGNSYDGFIQIKEAWNIDWFIIQRLNYTEISKDEFFNNYGGEIKQKVANLLKINFESVIISEEAKNRILKKLAKANNADKAIILDEDICYELASQNIIKSINFGGRNRYYL